MLSEPTRYVRSADGVRIAWTESGSGPRTLVLSANHITDFQRDAGHPNRRDMVARLTEHFRVIRYDHRGTGSSQRNVERQGQAAWVEDLEAVVRAASPSDRVILSAASQASPYAAIFAARHPELVSHLVLLAPTACGAIAGGDAQLIRRIEAMLELIRVDWAGPIPTSRLLAAPAIFPEPTAAEIAWTELFPLMANAQDAERFFRGAAVQDARDILPTVRTPALVMATAEDKVILPEWSRMVAAAIPGAVYVELPGRRHAPVRQDPNFEPYLEHLLAFVSGSPAEDPLAELSARERDILDGVCSGLSNEAIALQREISAKTVRNHLTRIFDKLRVNSRTQAALLATRAS